MSFSLPTLGTNLAPMVRIGEAYYSTRAFEFGLHEVLPLLTNVPEIRTTARVEDVGTVQALTVSLFTESLRGLITGEVEYSIVNPDTGQQLILFTGDLRGGVKWSDDDNTVSFTVESEKRSFDVGYAPADDGYAAVAELSAGSVWPIVFGDVSKLKAIPLQGQVDTLFLAESITDLSTTIKLKNTKGLISLHQYSGTYVLLIDGVRFTVTVTPGNNFTISGSNAPYYSNLPITTNDKDSNYWLTLTDSYDLVDKWVMLSYGGNTYSNYCTDADAHNYRFQYPWPAVLSSGAIAEVTGQEKASWLPFYRGGLYRKRANWTIEEGTPVALYAESSPSRYLIADHHIDEVVQVYAERTYHSYTKVTDQNGNEQWQELGSGQTLLASLPPSHYTLVNGTLNGRACAYLDVTTKTLGRPPWGKELWVSFRSGRTKNAAEIIEALLTHTEYTADATSFAAVETLVDGYPCNFAITSKKDAMTLCREIAYQSRCGLTIWNGVVYITYLSQAPSSPPVFSDSTIRDRGYVHATDGADSLAFDLSATWRKDGYFPAMNLRYGRQLNDSVGYEMRNEDFYIYAHEELVRMSLYFWGYRKCKSWPLYTFEGFIDGSGLFPYDVARLTSLTDEHGWVQEFSLRLSETSYTLQCDDGDSNFWIGDPAYPVQAVSVGDVLANDGPISYKQSVPRRIRGEDEAAEKYSLNFVAYPKKMRRGRAYTFALETRDSTGKRKYVNEDILLYIQNASDPGDSISPSGTVRMRGGRLLSEYGVWGGETPDADAELRADVPGKMNIYIPAVTELIEIDSTGGQWANWVTVPIKVWRGIPFTVEIEGGAELNLSVSLLGADERDEITPASITLDETEFTYKGEFTIEGGVGEIDNVVLVLKFGEDIEVESSPFMLLDHAAIPVMIEVTHADEADWFCSIYGKGPYKAATETNVPVKVLPGLSPPTLYVGMTYLAYKLGEVAWLGQRHEISVLADVSFHDGKLWSKRRTIQVPYSGAESDWEEVFSTGAFQCPT